MCWKRAVILFLFLAITATLTASCGGGQRVEDECISFTLGDDFEYYLHDPTPEEIASVPLSEISRIIISDKDFPHALLVFISYPYTPDDLDLMADDVKSKTVNGTEVLYSEDDGLYTQCFLDPEMPVAVKAVSDEAAMKGADRIIASLKVKRALELTPEEQAVNTVVSYMAMCKQGRVEETAGRFSGGDYRGMITLPPSINDIADFTVELLPTDAPQDHRDETIDVKAVIQTNAGEEVGLLFTCSEDGKYIIAAEEDNSLIQEEFPPAQEDTASEAQTSSDERQAPSPEREWIIDRLIYADFIPDVERRDAEAIITNHSCEIHEWGYLKSEDVFSYTIIVPEGSNEIDKVREFQAEPLVYRTGDYYWEKKIERMVDSDHVQGEVIVRFVDGIDDAGAMRILASHGYGADQVRGWEYFSRPTFTVHFSYTDDDKDEMIMVIRDFLLDDRIEFAEPNYLCPLGNPEREGILQVVFVDGVEREEAEAVIATYNCEIISSAPCGILAYIVRIHEGESEEEAIREFMAEPTVQSAARPVVW